MGKGGGTQQSATRSEMREREAGGKGFRAEPRRAVFLLSNDAPNRCGSNGATPDPRSFLELEWQPGTCSRSNRTLLTYDPTSVLAGAASMVSMQPGFEERGCIWAPKAMAEVRR